MTKMGHLFVISGSSGVGKGTLIKELLKKHPDLSLSTSATTRAPRIGEVDGDSYLFMSKEKFKKKINKGEFLEFAELFGNYYGTLKKTVEDALKDGKDLILEIDVQGATQIKKKLKEAIFIFISPPSFEELKNRLINRHTESPEIIEKRLAQAQYEREQSSQFDHNIINDNLEDALKKVEDIVIKERYTR